MILGKRCAQLFSRQTDKLQNIKESPTDSKTQKRYLDFFSLDLAQSSFKVLQQELNNQTGKRILANLLISLNMPYFLHLNYYYIYLPTPYYVKTRSRQGSRTGRSYIDVSTSVSRGVWAAFFSLASLTIKLLNQIVLKIH